MSSERTREAFKAHLERQEQKRDRTFKDLQSIWYQVTGLGEGENDCSMTIVELSTGWRKGIKDETAILDLTLEAIAGLRYKFVPEKDNEAEVFTRSSGELSANTGYFSSMSLLKGKKEVSFNSQKNEWKNEGGFSKPVFKGRVGKDKKGFATVSSDKTVEYDLNGKIIGVKVERKPCN